MRDIRCQSRGKTTGKGYGMGPRWHGNLFRSPLRLSSLVRLSPATPNYNPSTGMRTLTFEPTLLHFYSGNKWNDHGRQPKSWHLLLACGSRRLLYPSFEYNSKNARSGLFHFIDVYYYQFSLLAGFAHTQAYPGNIYFRQHDTGMSRHGLWCMGKEAVVSIDSIKSTVPFSRRESWASQD